jgi:hypothetical protein
VRQIPALERIGGRYVILARRLRRGRKEFVMAKKATSSRTSKGPEATSAAHAAVIDRPKVARKATGGKKPAVQKKPASAKEPAGKAASAPKAKAGQSRSGSKSTRGKSSIASKVVEGLKATATGAIGAVSLAAQALTADKKPGKRK